MKKSERIHTLMLAVVESDLIAKDKLELLTLLDAEKKSAEWDEKRKAAGE